MCSPRPTKGLVKAAVYQLGLVAGDSNTLLHGVACKAIFEGREMVVTASGVLDET